MLPAAFGHCQEAGRTGQRDQYFGQRLTLDVKGEEDYG